VSEAGSFGALLRQEREAAGVGLDELSRATKVRRVLLEALEGERWEEMPSRVFVVGYLRAIADHLHTDAAGLQSALDAAWPAREEPLQKESPEEGEVAPSGLRLWGGVALACAVAAAAIVWLLLRTGEPAAPPAPSPAPAAAEPQALPEAPATRPPVIPAEASATPGGVPQVPPAVEAPSPPAPQPLSVTSPGAAGVQGPAPVPTGDLWIEASAPCWMELYAGERRLVFRQVQAGEHLSFDGRGFSLTLGDASVCRVFWKGKAVALPAKAGTVARGITLGEGHP